MIFQEPPTDREHDMFQQAVIEGRPLEEVAAHFEVRVARVERVIDYVRRWLADYPQEWHVDAGLAKLLQLRRLEHQWRETMAAWHRSKSDEETSKVARDAAGAKTPSKQDANAAPQGKQKVELTKRTRAGDVRYLELARRLLDEIRRLSEQLEEQRHVRRLTLDQREAELDSLLAAAHERAQAQPSPGADLRVALERPSRN